MAPTITVGGDEIIDASIDGDAVEEITIDGDLAWAAAVGLDGLTVTRQDGSYTASSGEHVVSNGGTITLPSPVQDGVVMVTEVQTSPQLTGTVDGITDPYISGDESVVFVSDGSAWYSVDRNQIIAIPDSVVDNFDAAQYDDKSATLSTYYSGSLSAFNRQQTTVYEGSYALEGTSGGTSTEIYSTPSDGLNRYPQRGEIITWWTYLQSTSDIPYQYFFTDFSGGLGSENGYAFKNFPNNDGIRITRLDSGSETNLNTTTVTAPTGTWFKSEVVSTSSELTYRIFDGTETDTELASVSVTDSNHSYQGLGFWSRQGSPKWDSVESQ